MSKFRIRQKLYRSSAVGWVWYNAAWRDDRKITVEDVPETAAALGAMGLIWWDTAAMAIGLSSTPFVAVEVTVVAGAVASYSIAGTEGVENYIDFITEPSKWIERGGPPIQKYITEPTIEYVTEELWQRQLVDPISGWVERRREELEEGWESYRRMLAI